ncbi:MAG TPA: AmmeMemoRadiSam system protein B, partial [bacterium]
MEFAGSWYPANADACRGAIVGYASNTPPVAARFAVAPHAGWRYSGALAAKAYQSLAAGGDAQLVIVLGGHLRRADPLVAMAGGQWQTPFGPLALHPGTRGVLAGLPQVEWESAAAYNADNSMELQLPFVKHHFPSAELLVMRIP